MTMSVDSLRRRVDKALAVVEDQLQQQKAAEQEQIFCITVRLPVKDNEPPVGYQHGPIYFYVPEHRLNEVA